MDVVAQRKGASDDFAPGSIYRATASAAKEQSIFRRYGVELTLVLFLALAVLFFAYLAIGLLPQDEAQQTFEGERAQAHVGNQLSHGARATGTQSSLNMTEWLIPQLTGLGWDVIIQEFTIEGTLTARNLMAVRSPDGATADTPVALITTHYDTRLAADRDPNPDNTGQATPGANAGASGPAVLLELARALSVESSGQTICLFFADADANAGIPGWTGLVGSNHMAQTLNQDIPRCASPRAVISLDMVGGANATFRRDPQSDSALQEQIWQIADEAGYGDLFVDSSGGVAVTSQTAFAAAGYPALLIADLTYAYAATVGDTSDKIDARTLEAVGRTLELWLEGGITPE